jgi:hypothetical protein
MTNSSPNPASNTSSGGTLLSLQPKYGGVRLLVLGEIRQNFLLHGRKSRVAADKARIAFLQTIERLLAV